MYYQTSTCETLPELTLDDVGSERYDVNEELQAKINASLKSVRKIQEELETLKTKRTISKKDISSLSSHADAIVRELKANIPFIEHQFNESIESTIDEMAATVDAMFTDVVTRLGLDALKERYGAIESAIDIQPSLMIKNKDNV